MLPVNENLCKSFVHKIPLTFYDMKGRRDMPL